MYRQYVLLIVFLSLIASADQHADTQTNACHMSYPNIDGELLLENDHVVVQRFTIQPGQWEGIHRHPRSQLYIQLTDGEWRYKSGGESDEFGMSAGDISWNETSTELDAQHESGNIGTNAINYIWVGVKPGCLQQP